MSTRKPALTQPASARRDVAAFLVVAFSAVLALALALPHAHANVPLSALVPTLAVVVVIPCTRPRGERRAAWREVGLGRLGRSSWAAALLIPFALMVGAYGIALAVGAGHLRPLALDRAGDFTAGLVTSLVIVTLFMLGEEIGWRGFLLPRLRQLTSPGRAAVATGFCHGCFHLPLILLATTYDADGPRWFVATTVVVTITAAGVFYAWLRDRSGSVWPVALGHGAANCAFDVGAGAVAGSPLTLAYVAGESGVATMAVVVALAVLLLRRRAGRGPAAVPVTA